MGDLANTKTQKFREKRAGDSLGTGKGCRALPKKRQWSSYKKKKKKTVLKEPAEVGSGGHFQAKAAPEQCIKIRRKRATETLRDGVERKTRRGTTRKKIR